MGATFKSKNVFITGATGFIGSHLSRRLVAESANVFAFVRATSARSRLDDIASDIEFLEGDLTDLESLKRAMTTAKPEYVFHFGFETSVRASVTPIEGVQASLRTNIQGSLNLLQAVDDNKDTVQRLIRSGGLEEYGDGPHPYLESQREKPVSPYSASQVAVAHYFQMYQKLTPVDLITLRLALIYGPAQSQSFFIPSLIVHCLLDQPFAMTSGQQYRDLLYIDDAIESLVLAAGAPGLSGQVINISSNTKLKMRTVADKIVAATGCSIPISTVEKTQRYTDIEHLVADNGYADALLNWKPSTAFDQGLEKTISWYRDRLNSGDEIL